MKKQFAFLLLLVTCTTLKAQDFLITQYGASLDSTQINTPAIQRAIDKASESGGGTIVIPKGVFLTGALFFKTGTHLRLQEGAVLKGSDDIANFPLIPSRMEGHNLLYYAAVINAYFNDGFSITGPGTINGNGLKYWQTFWAGRDSMRKVGKEFTNLEAHRPRLVFLWGCHNATISGVKLYNSPFWTTHLYQCENVLIENCDIRSPFRPVPAPSSDAIDIDVCRNVTVRNCYISVNDDGVCIKGGKGPDAHKRYENGMVEDVLVENCTFGETHSALTMGSECIHARHIVMRNCKVDNNCPILRLKMRPDTYQLYEDITVEHITGKCGIIIDMAPWTQYFNLNGSKEKPYGTVRNITFSDINVSCGKFIALQGNPTDTVTNIVFNNVTATAKEATFNNIYKDVKFENVTLNGKKVSNP
jgi:polygalacturonase